MKHLVNGALGLALLSVVFLTSCGTDEDPTVKGSIEVMISGLPSGSLAQVTVSGPDNFSQTLNSSADLTDLTLGIYTFTIGSVEASNELFISSETETTINLTNDTPESLEITYAEWSSVNGIVGTWVSAGSDVAVLLSYYFAVDSIVAVFKADQTYEVKQYSGGGTSPSLLSGTYVQSASSTGAIWTITADQTSPSTLTSTGIFEINTDASPNSMQYEIVQSTPDIGAVAPTPAGGFGSTNAGALGTSNIQVYKRRSY